MRNPFVAAMMMAIARFRVIDPCAYDSIDSSNCGASDNGGRRHTVAQAKREALKARTRKNHKRQCRRSRS